MVDGLPQSEPFVPVAQVIRLIAGRAADSGSRLREAAHAEEEWSAVESKLINK